MKKLLLFDIDGTIVNGSHSDRWGQAIKNIHGLSIKLDVDFRGYTDYTVLVALLESHGWSANQIAKARPELIKEVDKVHKQTFTKDTLEILPGVVELLKTLEDKAILGLITGNLEPVAKRKLSSVGLWDYFKIGGFGSDPHTTRADLVTAAINKAGYQQHIDKVYVIGDTPRDIIAAKEAGVSNTVGVANGFRPTQELKTAGAKIVLEDFKDTEYVLSKLGI